MYFEKKFASLFFYYFSAVFYVYFDKHILYVVEYVKQLTFVLHVGIQNEYEIFHF